jgi:uncharacterized membrane protein YhaH (DUF805 family)
MNRYLAVLKNYGFSGRVRKKEYWMLLLFNMILDNVLGISMAGGHRL